MKYRFPFSIIMNNTLLLIYVIQLVNRYFQNCSLLLLQDSFEDVFSQRANFILLKTVIVPKFMINFYNDTNSVKKSSKPIQFSIHTFNVRHHSDQCAITLLLINQISFNFMEQVKDLIAPTYLPISRKDMDYYMFIAEPKIHEKLLRMKMFVSKIKFKVAVGTNNQARLEMATVNFFGGTNGSPKLVHLSVEKALNGKSDVFPDFIWNLGGYTLQVVIPYARAILEAKPAPWTEINNGKRGSWKYLFEEYLMVKFNFTYRMFPSTGKDGKIGSGGTGVLLPNNTWIGATGDLYYGRADLGLAIANTGKRTCYIGFTDTYFDYGCLTFVTGQPSEVYSSLAILWTFQFIVWLWIIVSIVGTMCLFFVVTKFLQQLQLESSSINVGTQIMLILVPFVEQDCDILPISSPLRSFLAFWSFFSLIVTNLYRSKLVTLLAFPVLGTVPNTFEQLAYSDFEVGFMKDGDSAYNTFSNSKDPVYVDLIQRMEVIKGVNVDCLEKVVNNEKYGCIAYDFDVKYLQQKNFSDMDARKLKYSNARTYNIWLGIATEAQSIYRVNFGKVLGQTTPFHLAEIWSKMDMYANVRKLKLKWWRETNQIEKMSTHEESGNELTLSNIQGVFYIFMYCVIASILAFLNEFFKWGFLTTRIN